MSWRTIVIKQRAKLDLKMGYMVIRNEETIRIHIEEIAVLIIESTAVSLTTALLSELIKNKIKIIFCDEKCNPESELLPYYGSYDTSIRVRSQINWDVTSRGHVWTEIVKNKITQQASLLKDFDHDKCDLLYEYITQLKYNDESNREGHAAKVYFNALFGKSFSRTKDDIINSSLNYGYSIILSAFNRIVCSNGYLTQIGIFHNNMFNSFNLSCDLMEPFRPLIDRKVLLMANEKFEWDEKQILINVLNEEIKVDGKKHHCINGMNIYAKSIFEAIESNDISHIKFYEL